MQRFCDENPAIIINLVSYGVSWQTKQCFGYFPWTVLVTNKEYLQPHWIHKHVRCSMDAFQHMQ